MEELEKAGEIAIEAVKFSKGLIKENALVLDIANKIENKIVELGGKPAFPVGISLNHIAAHSTPLPDDQTRLKEGDIVKIDLGVHINGFIADTAYTIEISTNKNKALIKASKEALDKALEMIKPDIKTNEIGKVIQETIQSYGFSPIKNLSGHEIKQYKLHTGLRIPNYDDGNEIKLKKGMVIAIEPFATPGVGMIKEGKPSGIYELIEKKPIRNFNARKVLDYIEKNFRTLPFVARWLKSQNTNFLLRLLEKQEIIKQFNQLPEKSNNLVSQAEHTLIVGEKVLTRSN